MANRVEAELVGSEGTPFVGGVIEYNGNPLLGNWLTSEGEFDHTPRPPAVAAMTLEEHLDARARKEPARGFGRSIGGG